MKKNILCVIILLSSTMLFAQKKQVSIEEAISAANTWIKNNYPQFSRDGILFYDIDALGDTLLYEYKTDSISVILSGHKGCRPILGSQKFQGSLLTEKEKIPDGVGFFLDSYTEQIGLCFAHNLRDEGNEHEWDMLINEEQEPSRVIYVVRPLLKTQWGQSRSNDGYDSSAYNYYIRPGANCNHCLVGCGAVAMAQVMNYWQHPILFSNPRQFDWCNMTNLLSTTNYFYEKNRDAIAYLMYVCAELITENDDWGCESTTSDMPPIRNALVHLGYNNNCSYRKLSDYSLNDWENMIKGELDDKRPVIYRGEGTSKHVFVCDGYTNDGLFHFNWGSVNTDPGNFALTAITPTNYNNIQYDFSRHQEAIFKISPINQQDICNIYLILNDFYSINSSLLNDYEPYEITPQTMTSLTSASATSDASWRTIPTGATAVYQAHEEIILQDGFEAQLGCEFEARIEPCEQCEELRRESSSEYDEDVARGDYDRNEENLYSTGRVPQTTDPDLFPNPTDGPLTMYTDGEPKEVFVHTLDGRPVSGWRLTSHGDNFVTIDVSPLRSGPYLLSVVTSSGTRTARILRL